MKHRKLIQRRCCGAVGGLVLFFLLGLARAEAADSVWHVLIFSGQNNHAWRETTPKLKALLEADGRCAVEITEHPERCDGATLKKYDVLLSNWNTFGKPAVTNWPPAMRAAFLDFVRSGRGFVSVHAGSSSFYDWPEYQQLAGGAWKIGQTGHGPAHEFKVNLVAPTHPITLGLTNFITCDELWHRTALGSNVEILARAHSAPEWKGTGQEEAIAFTTHFGGGRTFNLLLGHDVKAMSASGFSQLLCRGTEWAATGKISMNR